MATPAHAAPHADRASPSTIGRLRPRRGSAPNAMATGGGARSGLLCGEVRDEPYAVVVVLRGNLDIYTVPELARVTEPLPSGRPLVVDITGVGLLDASGIGALLTLRNRLAQEGRRLGVVCGRMGRVLELAGVRSAFACADDARAAAAAAASA